MPLPGFKPSVMVRIRKMTLKASSAPPRPVSSGTEARGRHREKHFIAAIILAGVFMAVSSSAPASPAPELGPPVYGVGTQCGGVRASTPVSFSCSLPSGMEGDLNYAGSANGLPQASIAMALSSDPGGRVISESLLSQVQYDMEIVGPLRTTPINVFFVPTGQGNINVDASGYSTGIDLSLATGGDYAIAETCISINVDEHGETDTNCAQPGAAPITNPGTTTSMLIQPNTLVPLILSAAIGETFASSPIDGSNAVVLVNGFVDPYTFVDPMDPMASEYTVVLSDGIGNSPPSSSVPEPSGLALLGSFMFGLLPIARSRSARSREPGAVT
jgi:hypothetical protein